MFHRKAETQNKELSFGEGENNQSRFKHESDRLNRNYLPQVRGKHE